jgi:hypothetical protein
MRQGKFSATGMAIAKTRHTLFAALLDAAGLKSYPALISSSRRIDPDVPSPAQFDHVIDFVPRGNTSIWLDTTPEVSPFAYLLTPLPGNQALVIADDKPPVLLTIPAEPLSPAIQSFQIAAKLSDDGTLEGNIENKVQGDDTEVSFRSAFRTVAMPQWNELAQKLSNSFGFAGTVSDVTASSPEATSEPFRFSYHYHRKDYPDWENQQITPRCRCSFCQRFLKKKQSPPPRFGCVLRERSVLKPKSNFRRDIRQNCRRRSI